MHIIYFLEKLKGSVDLICTALQAKSDALIKLVDFHGAKQALVKAYKLKTPNLRDRKAIEHNLRIGRFSGIVIFMFEGSESAKIGNHCRTGFYMRLNLNTIFAIVCTFFCLSEFIANNLLYKFEQYEIAQPI